MSRTVWALAALLIVGAGCGGGTDGTPVAPPTAPAPTPPPAPEPAPPPDPPIEITPVGRGISVTSENQILLELMSEDVVSANPLDLAGRTLMFTPAGGGYSREVRALDWDEDLGDPVDDNAEIVFQFDFAGREWESFFVSRYGLVTFGEPYPFSQLGPDRWGTMAEIAEHLGAPPVIAALYKPRLGGWGTYDAEQFGNTQHVSRRPDRVVVTWITTDAAFHVHGVPPQEKTRFQMTLHADGGIAFHYAPEPDDSDEAIRDGIVGLFPGAVKTGLLGSIPDSVDGSVPAHLDLVETALYATAEPDRVLVEFTTRGPIRPIPNQEIFYIVAIDDWDFFAGVALQPDGSRTAAWDAEAAYDRDVDDNRIGLLFDPGEFSGHSTSVRAFARSRNQVTGSWGPYGEHSAVISFPEVIASAPTDLSEPGSSAAAREVFHHTGVKDYLVPLGCRVIETLGDEFDAIFLHSQFRYDIQFSGSWWGYYPGNVPIRGIGFPERLDERKSPCGTRLRGQWNFTIWTKSDFVAVLDDSGGLAPSSAGTSHLAHEFTHTWTASASYVRDGEIEPLWGEGGHWLPGLHTPAAFVRTGSIMGGDFWQRERRRDVHPRRVRDGVGRRTLLARSLPVGLGDRRRSAGHVLPAEPPGDGGWLARTAHGREGNRDDGTGLGRAGAARPAARAVTKGIQHWLRLPAGAGAGARSGPVEIPRAIPRRCARILGSHHRRTKPAYDRVAGPLANLPVQRQANNLLTVHM